MRGSNFFSQLAGNQTKAGHDTTVLQAPLTPIPKAVVVVIQSLSHVPLSATPWTAARQASPSFTTSRSLLKLMSIESVMPSNHFILYCTLLQPSILPSIRVFPVSQLLASGGQSIGALASASVLPMNIQDFRIDWFDLLAVSRVFSMDVFLGSSQPRHW